MNSLLKTGLFVGGALLAYNAFTKANALQTLNFYPKGVSGISFEGVTPIIKLNLAIQNTSNQQMVIRSLAGNLFANGFLIGNVSSYNVLAIRPNAESIFSITVRLSLLGVVQDIIDAIKGNGFSQEIEFQARANVDRYNIPINIKYSIG